MKFIKPAYLLDSLPIFSILQSFSRAVFKKLSLLVIMACPLLAIAETSRSRILYPVGYLPIGSLKENQFSKALQILDSPCVEKCSNQDLALAVRASSPKQYQTLGSKIKEQDKDCLRDLLKNLGNLLKSENFPKACLNEEKKLRLCKNMLESLKITKKRVGDLMAMAYDPAVLTEAGAFCTDCLNWEKETELSQLQNSLTNLTRLNPCLELGPGEEKRIKPNASPLFLKPDYMLKRDTEGNYHIDFPVEFYAHDNYDGDTPRKAVPSVYREKVQKCLKEANTMMLGPNGEKINLSISKIPECSTQKQSRPTRIAIGLTGSLSYSHRYAADIDCPLIVHEILHLAGLCDEYEDKFRGWYIDSVTGERIPSLKKIIPPNSNRYRFKPRYDCRVVIENSIMSNEWERWNYAKENNKSLLSYGHFNSILYGSCLSKNQQFIECSALSYQSTLDNDSCLVKKAECENNNGLGQHNKQEWIESWEEELASALSDITRTKENIKELEQKQSSFNFSLEELNQIEEIREDIVKQRIISIVNLKRGSFSNNTTKDKFNKLYTGKQLRGSFSSSNMISDLIIPNNDRIKEFLENESKLKESQRRLKSYKAKARFARNKLEIIRSWPDQ